MGSEFSLDGPAFKNSTRQVIRPDHIMPLQEDMDSKFSLDGPAFENSTRHVIRPDHIMLLQEEEEGVHQLTPKPSPGPLPTTPPEDREQAPDAPENPVLKCIMEDACDDLHVFQEFEHYSLAVNPESESDVPEDELTDEMEDTCSDDGDQLDPVNLQDEEYPTVEGVHDQPSPVIIPVEDINVATEGNETSPVNPHLMVVNVSTVTEPDDSNTPRRLDFSIVTFDSVHLEADQEVIPENQLEDQVQTVPIASAAKGDSIASSWILLDIHVSSNTPESEESYELLHVVVIGDSVDIPDVNETA